MCRKYLSPKNTCTDSLYLMSVAWILPLDLFFLIKTHISLRVIFVRPQFVFYNAYHAWLTSPFRCPCLMVLNPILIKYSVLMKFNFSQFIDVFLHKYTLNIHIDWIIILLLKILFFFKTVLYFRNGGCLYNEDTMDNSFFPSPWR